MLEYDKNKIPKALEIATKLRDMELSNDKNELVIVGLNILIGSLSDNKLTCYGLGSTLPLTFFSLSDALTDDPYDYFVDLVEKHHEPLDGRKIVEVAAGVYPIVSSKLLKRNPNIERIDVYDPMMIHNEGLDLKIHLHRCGINAFTQIDSDSLIISMQPCSATFQLLDLIKRNEADSLVMLCTCSDAMMYGFSDEVSYEWYSHVKESIKKAESDYYEVGFNNTKYQSPVTIPYFYTKRHYVDDEDVKEKDVSIKKKTNE